MATSAQRTKHVCKIVHIQFEPVIVSLHQVACIQHFDIASNDWSTTQHSFDDVDDIEEILAASSHDKPPLLRSKTLPAILRARNSISHIIDTNSGDGTGSTQSSPSHIADKIFKIERKRRRSLPRVSFSSVCRGSEWEGDEKNDAQLVTDMSTKESTVISPIKEKNESVSSSCSDEDKARMDQSVMINSSCRSGFGRFTRRLSNKEKKEPPSFIIRQRRAMSIDCGDMLKASSVENIYKQGPKSIPSSPSASNKLNKKIPTSPSMPSRLQRNSPGKRKGSLDLLESNQLSKADRKKLEKLSRNITDLQALFVAVEHQELEKVEKILINTEVDINSVNGDEVSLLDIAILTNQIPMTKLLLSHGAQENPKFQKRDLAVDHFCRLVSHAEKRVSDLTSLVLNAATTNSTVSTSLAKDQERLLGVWEGKLDLLQRMKTEYEHTRIPEVPSKVILAVSSISSLLVSIEESADTTAIMPTKYRVQWSTKEDFSEICDEQDLLDLRKLQMEICDLIQGTKYYVQVAAGNYKGFSAFQVASPPAAIPSVWREVDQRPPRMAGRLSVMDNLFMQIRNSRSADASEIKDWTDSPCDSPIHQRRSQVRKSLKQLFTAAPKFQKTLRRGVHLACLLYHDQRVLLTAEDNLPILEVDESFTSTLHTDFHWMMKVACTWEDCRSLKQDMDKSSSSSTTHFRSKLLQAAIQMQNALGIQDLGQFHYKPLKDNNGTVVITTINYVRDPKTIQQTAVKWVPLIKIQKKLTISTTSLTASEMLLSAVPEQICYHHGSTLSLPRGLYLGYLKLRSSVDLIRVLVPAKSPNVLPHCLIRDNPHVSKEEWEWLRYLDSSESDITPTAAQLEFQETLSQAAKQLLNMLKVNEEEGVSHRIYDVEVIEFSSDVSFILVLPPAENVCSVPGQNDELTRKEGYLSLPVQIFEMVHMATYQREFISKYSRLSSILEMDTIMAQHADREAFSSNEVLAAKQRLTQLQQFQQNVDDMWKNMRWIMNVLTYARDKQVKGGMPLGVLHVFSSCDNKRSFDYGDVFYDEMTNLGVASNDRDINMTNESTFHTNSNMNKDLLKEDKGTVVNNVRLPGIIRVYAAYDCGLSQGTSVKLRVSPKTTAREVINLVIQQLNKAVMNKGLDGPIYSDEQLPEFCLVAILGTRERCLRDDYQPLKLQNPWIKGKLYIRERSNVLAAIQHSTATVV